VGQPLQEMGRRAVEVLLQRFDALRRDEPYPGPFNIVLPTEVVPGATLTGPRRTRLIID
jgi:LacI family transcriptional regulator